MRRVLPSEGGSHETRLRALGPRRAPREIVTSEQTMRAPGPLDDADARGGDVRTVLRCGGVLLPEGGSHETRLRGLGSRRAPREIVTSEQTMRAPDPLDANACGG